MKPKRKKKLRSFNLINIFLLLILVLALINLQVIFFGPKQSAWAENKLNVVHSVPESSALDNETSTDDKDADEKTKAVDASITLSQYLVLVNKDNILKNDYIPKNLVTPNVDFTSTVDPGVKKMESTAAAALEELFNAAKKDGINLLAVSGYRSYDYQSTLYTNEINTNGIAHAEKYVAKPGASEHQTGLAMDILSDEYSVLDEGFKNTKAYAWIETNAYKYGFIVRYDAGKESITKYSFEPWHIRYVGKNAASKMYINNETLEEFLAQ